MNDFINESKDSGILLSYQRNYVYLYIIVIYKYLLL